MESQILHTVWCNTFGEAAGETWNWSLLGVERGHSGAWWGNPAPCELSQRGVHPLSKHSNQRKIVHRTIPISENQPLTPRFIDVLTFFFRYWRVFDRGSECRSQPLRSQLPHRRQLFQHQGIVPVRVPHGLLGRWSQLHRYETCCCNTELDTRGPVSVSPVESRLNVWFIRALWVPVNCVCSRL